MSNNNDFDDPNNFFDRVLKSTGGQSQFWARRSFWGAVLMTVAVLALVTVIWLSYVSVPDVSDESQLPLIEASDDPYREIPEDPGGMDIRNQDSVIFDAMRGQEDNPQIENLLEGEEQPTREEALEESGMTIQNAEGEPLTDAEIAILKARLEAKRQGTTVDDILVAETTEDTAEEAAPTLPERGEFQETAPTESPEETLAYVRSVLDKKDIKDDKLLDTPETDTLAPVAETQEAAPTPASTSETAPEPVKEVAPAPASTNTTASAPTGPARYVQLGSFRDRESAMTLWSSMKKDFPGLFDGMDLRVQEADLGEKGIYYRAQAGTTPESRAKEICATIIAKKPNGCLVVAP